MIGKRSFGKGLVQRPKPIPYGGQLKVTISRYYTPSGRCIQALDYKNRGKDGLARKYREEDFKAFLTQNGRTVFDGGGVTPDVAEKNKESSKFIGGLINSAVVFDFANDYYHNNSLQDLKGFKLSKKGFDDFKKRSVSSPVFLEDESLTYLDGFANVIKDEGLLGINEKLEELKGVVNESKYQLMDRFKNEIVAVLEKEIVKRYYYRKGMYEFYLLKDEDVVAAKQLLNDTKVYLNILK